jgi:hypothetical protein
MRQFLLILMMVAAGWGDTHTAASGEYSACSLSISQSVSGDTVIVPADNVVFSATLIINKGITFKGSGRSTSKITAGGNITVLQYSPVAADSNYFFDMSGFDIDGNSTGNIGIKIYNGSSSVIIRKIRIHNNRVHHFVANDMYFDGMIYGCIDTNRIDHTDAGIVILGKNSASWIDPLQTGTKNYLYFENNDMDSMSDELTVTGHGARWVFRNNRINVGSGGVCILDIHGNLPNDGNPVGIRGCVGVEIYDNIITNINRVNGMKLVDHRGGSLIMYGNTLSGSRSGCEVLYNCYEEDDNDYGDPYPLKIDYPGYDSLNNSYYWNNKYNGDDLCFSNEDDGLMFQLKRDYWGDVKEWDGGSTTLFSWGTFSSRPGTCKTDTCYWTTDSLKLYKATATNIWTEVYKQYQYPHEYVNLGAAVVKNYCKVKVKTK